MSHKQALLMKLTALLILAGTLYYISPDISLSTNSNSKSNLTNDNDNIKVGCIARTTILSRGQDWVDKHVPYSQTGTHDGYRTDCSGFVSMCWQASKPGPSTS